MDKLDREIELQALITEREGMRAENASRMACGAPLLFGEGAFRLIAAKMRALKEER